jgi:hypothetical protein
MRSEQKSLLIVGLRVAVGVEGLIILGTSLLTRHYWRYFAGGVALTLAGMAPFLWFAFRQWTPPRRAVIFAAGLTIVLALVFVPSINGLRHPDDGLEALAYPVTGVIGCLVVGFGTLPRTEPYPKPPRPDVGN